MPDLAAFLPGLLILLLAAVMAWFAVGTAQNINRGNRLLRWLQDGLAALGPRTGVKWFGSSVVQLNISVPRHPYREAQVMVVLQPRDVGALWAISFRRGRRDFLVVRLSLIRAPRIRADLVDPRAWTASDKRRDEPEPAHREDWTDASGRTVRIDRDETTDVSELRSAWNAVLRNSGGPWRISVRPTVPHLEVHLLAPDVERNSSRRLLDDIGALARALSAEP